MHFGGVASFNRTLDDDSIGKFETGIRGRGFEYSLGACPFSSSSVAFTKRMDSKAPPPAPHLPRHLTELRDGGPKLKVLVKRLPSSMTAAEFRDDVIGLQLLARVRHWDFIPGQVRALVNDDTSDPYSTQADTFS